VEDLHRSLANLNQCLDWIRDAPIEEGALRMVVRRPAVDERDVLAEGVLDTGTGLVGDIWASKGSSSTPDGGPDPRAQVTVVNWRAMLAVAGSEDRCALSGDQLYVDLDVSLANLPAGSLLSVGDAVIEVNAKPHKGCAKFGARFGPDALRFVNLGPGRQLRLRGINTSVVRSGVVRVGDRMVVERPSGS